MCSLGVMVITGVKMALLWLVLVLSCAHGTLALSQDESVVSDESQLLKMSPLLPQMSSEAEKCQVHDFEKIPCGEPGISATQCQAINCCFKGQQCYYGKTVTVQCTTDGHFVLVVARDATLPRISLDSISMLGGNTGPCGPADSNTAFAIYYFPVTACGTAMTVNGDYVVYENRMLSEYDVSVGPHGGITRDTHFDLFFQCRYSGVSFATLAFETSVFYDPMAVIASGPLHVELRLGKGRCTQHGCVEDQVAYTSYYNAVDYPVTKVLREPVYVEVRIVGRTDPNIVLVLGSCWATASSDPHSFPQWDLLVNGCPYTHDHYLTKLIPVNEMSGLAHPTHYRRFVLKMFTFVDQNSMAPLHETLYIHCSTAVCLPSAQDSCQPRCNRRRRAVPSAGLSSPRTSGIVSSGKVIFIQAYA